MNDEYVNVFEMLRKEWEATEGDRINLPRDLIYATVIAGEGLEHQAQQARESRDTAIEDRRKAIAERDETRRQFADLKERLHEGEIENARLNGYLLRVREDDRAADGHEVLNLGNGETAVVPNRPDPNAFTPGGYPGRGYEAEAGTLVNRREEKRRVHWVNYGS